MRRRPVEPIVLDVLRLPDIVADPVPIKRMPRHRHVQIIKHSGFVHPDLSDHDLFRRTAVNPDRSRNPLFFHPRFQCSCRSGASRSEQIVPASVTCLPGRRMCRSYFLSQSRKRIVFRKKSDHRMSASPLCGKRRLKSGKLPLYRESHLFQTSGKSAG